MKVQRGYTYVAVLFLVALTATGLAAMGQAWRTGSQREKERELLFRGSEIAYAIAAYAHATPNPPRQYPKRLEDLLVDSRGLKPRHHLRRLYVDPFTGAADWELVPEPSQPGAFSGVRSVSTQALLRESAPDGTPVKEARDLLFSAQRARTNPAAASVRLAASAAPR
ncbi:type II secretion system protein [Roseateles sp. LKC17W]|uniref:Type II secretion system protein n=1 Tax=Pelomonas margarita TaxID=3299031 RepID=A0ABW7FQ41_9BURK